VKKHKFLYFTYFSFIIYESINVIYDNKKSIVNRIRNSIKYSGGTIKPPVSLKQSPAEFSPDYGNINS